ncbi:SusC/RagA family TonB-linked outer membrane protein [Echinicola marina]|uniref:SusC/RagA family TonB-linked outer membrane protein n=1 Tax=Echinicola marina TaxID=2859768 RepID=UPI001CF6558C|nr:SusC/RagA family TonB-linked outer membrane protein [Echinicola marina]UCS93361.1 SusC/RagA family TonB-linked outer membrane protein [Echinicola marina]
MNTDCHLRYIRRAIIIMVLGVLLPHIMLAQEEKDLGTTVLGPSVIIMDDYGNPVSGVEMKDGAGNFIASSNEEGIIYLDKELDGVFSFHHEGFYVIRKKIGPESREGDVSAVYLMERFVKSPKRMETLYGDADPEVYLGASSAVYTDQLSTTLGNTILHALPGRIAGLDVSQHSGMANPSTSGNSNADIIGNIPVNGRGTPSDNKQFWFSARGQGPVTVIDGIQRDLFSIDPENVESVTLQKDALSSILMGMRSSRGVLLIETKKPKDDQFRLSFTGQGGMQRLMNVPKPLSAYQYAYMLNEALQYDGKLPAYTSSDFQKYLNGSSPYTHPDVNWYDEVLKRDAPISSYNLNVNGAGGAARYYVGLSYMNQQGHFITSDANSYNTNLGYDRYLITSSVDVDVTEDFTVNATIFGRIEDGNQPGAGAFNILNDIFRTPNNAYPVYNPNGSYGGNTSFTNNLMAQTVNSGYIANYSKDAMVNIKLDYDFNKFIEGLSMSATSNVSTQAQSAIVRNKRSIVYQFLLEEGASLEEGTYTTYGSNQAQSNSYTPVSTYNSWYGQLDLTYDRSFGKHHVTGTLFADKKVETINYDLPRRPFNGAFKAKYDFAKKYMAEAAIVYSKYNGYRPGMQGGGFYAFGLGWDIAKEDFLLNADWLEQLKIRGIYGKTGNGIDNAGYYNWRQSYRNSVTDYTYLQGYSEFNQIATIQNNPMANPNLTWEKANKLNIGIDLSMWNNRLSFSGDYYRDIYFDMLQVRGKTIAFGGFEFPVENIGEQLRTGVELALTYQNNIGSFNYFLTGNWTQNRSEVLYMDEQDIEEAYRRRTGKPVGTTFGYVADGYFTSVEEIENYALFEGYEVKPGDMKYKDLNGDGLINEFDHTAIAGLKPYSFFGLTAGFNVKGLDFSVLLQGAYNRDININNDVMQAGFQVYGQQYGQAYQPVLGRWTPENKDIATHPRLTAGGNLYNISPGFATGSHMIKDGDYVRVKNVSIGYTLPPTLSRKIANAQVRIFANATNLFTFSHYSWVDPEVTNFTSYPNTRVISGGLNIKL